MTAPDRPAAGRALADVASERRRQVEVEKWTSSHDDNHAGEALALAAACYALPDAELKSRHGSGVAIWRVLWPWDREWLKRGDRRRDLVKAAALIVAEIERLDRITEITEQGGHNGGE